MLTVSLKNLRYRISLAMMAAAVMLTVSLVLADPAHVAVSAGNGSAAAEYLARQGWEVDENSCVHGVYTVPDPLDGVMASYNDLQLSQGFDLSAYCGKVVEKYSYTVTNYPGYETTDYIRANVFVYGDEVVAGDICSVRLDGFMEGLKRSDGKAET